MQNSKLTINHKSLAPRSLSEVGLVINLVYACAWCHPSTYQKLERDEEYSHGICEPHQEELLKQYSVLIKSRRDLKRSIRLSNQNSSD